jgi:hypothetical protein
MGWEYEIFQIQDEIDDMATARTKTKRSHSKKQLKRRIDRLKDDLKDLSEKNKLAAEVWIHLGTQVYEGKIGLDRGNRYAKNIEEYIEVLNAQAVREMQRKSPAAVAVRNAARGFKTFLEEYTAAPETTQGRARPVKKMRDELEKTEVAVALQAAKTWQKTADEARSGARKILSGAARPTPDEDAKATSTGAKPLTGALAVPIPGVSHREWRDFVKYGLQAQAKVAAWDETVAKHEEKAVPTVRVMQLKILPLAINAGGLTMKLHQFREGTIDRAALEQALAQVRTNLAANPTGGGADRLREVISQVEAELAPTPVATPPQTQTLATANGAPVPATPDTPIRERPNYLLLGGLGVGLIGAVVGTVFIVKKVRGKKKGGK